MSDEAEMELDPYYCVGWNNALEWAAEWIVNYSGGHSAEVVQYAKDNATSFRAAKLPAQQQSFFDAIRNDPYMPPKIKAQWLAMEPAHDAGKDER